MKPISRWHRNSPVVCLLPRFEVRHIEGAAFVAQLAEVNDPAELRTKCEANVKQAVRWARAEALAAIRREHHRNIGRGRCPICLQSGVGIGSGKATGEIGSGCPARAE